MRYIRGERLWEFTTAPSQASWRWDRWAFYAPRIRKVRITESLDGRKELPVAPEAIRLLRSSLPLDQQFPQPTTISCYIDQREKLISQCLPLISPILRNLDIVVFGDRPDAALDELMQSLAQGPATLQTLSFVHIALRPLPSLAQCISRHSSTLSNVTLRTPFEGNIWTSVCGLPQINTLGFHFYPIFHDDFPTPDIVDVLEELVESLSGRAITNLAVALPHPSVLAPVRSEAFALLGRVQGVRALVLTGEVLPKLEPQEIAQLGQSLGQLEELTIKLDEEEELEVPKEEAVTPETLLLFLQYFPSLKTLKICLYFQSIPSQVRTKPASSLERLHVRLSCPPTIAAITLVGGITAFLKSAIPSQARITQSWK
ncbi:hypothetical protein FRC04_002060 [Tulasnella sp. 424]|nr:hypothetical protein FRC04_002060 [Tulasnella sp. 424]KAG8975546.1 hypothetical protein FRC05_005615 [Tulasnella sp. 425]